MWKNILLEVNFTAVCPVHQIFVSVFVLFLNSRHLSSWGDCGDVSFGEGAWVRVQAVLQSYLQTKLLCSPQRRDTFCFGGGLHHH